MDASSTQAFLFADLAGFTALTEAHGDAEATELAESFAGRVRALLPEYGGELIKTIGDEVMVRVESPDRAVELGLRIVDELARPGLPPVRVGIHCGPAIPRNGDWFGGTVNLASRVNGAARTGEVLLTEYTKQCLQGNGFTIEPRGERYFRHLTEPVPIYRAVAPDGGAGHPRDRVDHRLRPRVGRVPDVRRRRRRVGGADRAALPRGAPCSLSRRFASAHAAIPGDPATLPRPCISTWRTLIPEHG